MPEAAISKVWRKRTSLSASAASACFLCRYWPICAPSTRIVLISRSSGWRTMLLEIESTPTVRPSKVTGKTKAPCTPASRTRGTGAERASRLTSELQIGSPLSQTRPIRPVPGVMVAPRELSANFASGSTPFDQTSSQRMTLAASSSWK